MCISIDPSFSNAQENPRLVEAGPRERDEAAVSAGEAGRLHRANHLHPGKAASHPHWPGDHGTIPAALRGRKRELFPLEKCDEDGRPGTSSRLYYISSWAMCWPTDHPKKPVSG